MADYVFTAKVPLRILLSPEDRIEARKMLNKHYAGKEFPNFVNDEAVIIHPSEAPNGLQEAHDGVFDFKQMTLLIDIDTNGQWNNLRVEDNE